MLATFHNSIDEIDPSRWDALWDTRYPFTRHAFLRALEHSNSVDGGAGESTGWSSQHLTVTDDNTLVAAMPLFVKHHSYGEYVFDWSWANAYHQAGLDYYPKLLNAIPFTPATGPRVAFSPAISAERMDACRRCLFEAIRQAVSTNRYSGFHSLFPNKHQSPMFDQFNRRVGYQFHWFNQGYKDFEDFLGSFSSRKRKNLKKERNKVARQPLQIKTREAVEIPTTDWDKFYALYHRTYLKRSGHAGYLGEDFFHLIAQAFPDQVLMISAHHSDNMVAAALYLRDDTTLYGRYWGTMTDIDGLHFECCYYRGIEYAIAEGLQRFDPGAQGEHKIQRGFTPIETHSYHHLNQAEFDRAIAGVVKQEAIHVARYIQEARTLLPFKDGIKIPESHVLTRDVPLS